MSGYQFDVERPGLKLASDPVLVSAILLLVGVGLVTLYSASFPFAERFFGDGLYFIRKQMAFAGLGFAAFLIASRVNLDLLRRFVKPLVLGSILLCLLTFIPGIGVMKNGAARWIRLGSSTYQPSELVKVILPVYLAHIFDKKQDRLAELSGGVLPPALVTLFFFLLIYLQNNFSTAAFITINAMAIFYFAGVRLRYFAASALVIAPVSLLLVLTKEHRLRRIVSFIKPEWDPLGASYQVRSSVAAIASGDLWGKGFGQGTRKIANVPEVHSDFVFSAFAEELGLVGVVLAFALFALFLNRSYRAARTAEGNFRRLLACGLATTIASQALLNVAVVVGALPATGIPLPFFSAGGSSLATTLFAAGLIVNVSRLPRTQEAARA
jgi:cell division protein FtsW